MFKLSSSISALALMTGIIFFNDCRLNPSSKGKKLTARYCSSCHLPAYPESLDSITWIDHVLPAMAPKLGIRVWRGNQYYQVTDNNHPAIISYKDWMELVNYYKRAAPRKLIPAKPPVALKKDWSVFSLKRPVWGDSSAIATTTMVVMDTIGHSIYSCDMQGNLYQWNKRLEPLLFRHLPFPAVNASFFRDSHGVEQGVFTSIGILQPVDQPTGSVIQMDLDDKKDTADKILASGLPRPVQAVPGDFNRDGLTDWVICGFGHNEGGLYLLQQQPGHHFKKKSIREVPGAEEAVVGDFNGDGWPDIMALFAQADEGIWMFLNDHKGGFITKNLLRFPPEYGSTSFQLVDFNHDGKPDILYTCGDNGDYSQILKPFHGVYIFINQGDFHFKQDWFYPMNGCTKAIAKDFDKDGRLGIAAIAYYADLKNNPAESFIYFEQDRPLHFVPHAIPVYPYGRWLTMDVNDYDQDGDLDIVLGNFSKGSVIPPDKNFRPAWDTHLPMIVLENTTNNLISRSP